MINLPMVMAGTFGSIPETLAHLVRAEERYLSFLTEKEFSQAPKPGATRSLTELQERVRQSGVALQKIATQIQPDIEAPVGEGEEAEMLPAYILLLQAIHHAHEHRTQAATILGQLGIEPPALSGWAYYDEEVASKQNK